MVVLTPSSSVHILIVSSVALAPLSPVAQASATQSMMMFFLSRPAFSARSMIFLAISTLFSEVVGMPASSMQSPTRAAPYSAASGTTTSIRFSSPVVELIPGLPTTCLSAMARTSGFDVSIQSGTSTAPCTILRASSMACFSSMPGTPTLMSRTSAPLATCFFASPSRMSNSPALSFAISSFLLVGLILSPTRPVSSRTYLHGLRSSP